MTYADLETEIIVPSYRLWLVRGRARRVLRAVILEWEPWYGDGRFERSLPKVVGGDLRRRVRQRMAADEEYGNPLIFLWIIGVIINLFLQLWLSRNKETRGAELVVLTAEVCSTMIKAHERKESR